MDYRTGKCSQCGAEYKVPASFAHNVARCKKCKGVVHLSPAKSAGAAPAPAPAAMPAKRVVPKPAAARPSAPQTPAASPTPPAAPAGERPRGGTLERLKSERQKSQPAMAEPAPAAPAAASRAPRAGAKTAAGSAKADAEERGSSSRARRGERGRGRAPKEKKPPVAGILALVVLVVAGAGAYLFRDSLFGGGAQAAEESTETAQEPATETPASAPAVAEPPPPVEEAEREVVEPAPEETKPAKAEPKSKDPSSIDLAGMPDFEPTPDTSAEEWAQMKEWAAQWMDVDAGAAGNRAKLELIKQTRKAVPAILNVFKKLDFATKEGRSNGDQCQKALQQICNGTNFDWRYADEANGRGYDNPDDVWFCKKVVELWGNSWKQGEKNINAWIKMAKLDDKDPAEAARLRERFGGQSAPEELDPGAGKADDLDVD